MQKKLIFITIILLQSAFASEQVVVSPYCWNNQDVKYLYYKTPYDANKSYLNDTWYHKTNPSSNTFKPIWDLRYVNSSSPLYDASNHASYTGLDTRNGYRASAFGTSISRWNNAGSIVQTKCVNGLLVGGVMINLWDAPRQYIPVAGPQAMFAYQINGNVYPWRNGRNLKIQANFDMPNYYAEKNQPGGNINFNLYIRNKHTGHSFNYVIKIFGYNKGYSRKDSIGKVDPNTGIAWAEAGLKSMTNGASYATRSQYSNMTLKVKPNVNNTSSDDNRWPYFFKANISYQNLQKVLNDAHMTDEDTFPENWEISMIGIQYEIEEDEKGNLAGRGSISGSFYGFRVDTTDKPE